MGGGSSNHRFNVDILLQCEERGGAFLLSQGLIVVPFTLL